MTVNRHTTSCPRTSRSHTSRPVHFCFRPWRIGATMILIASLAGCSWNEDRTGKLGGTVGGVIGGILGSGLSNGKGRTAAIIIGSTLGAMWGEDIARGMTKADKIFAERATKSTLEHGEPGDETVWSNPESGNSGRIRAAEKYRNKNGEDCRNFETTAEIDGKERITTGTACRTPDGEWQVTEEPA